MIRYWLWYRWKHPFYSNGTITGVCRKCGGPVTEHGDVKLGFGDDTFIRVRIKVPVPHQQ